jgi:hypothetical protein
MIGLSNKLFEWFMTFAPAIAQPRSRGAQFSRGPDDTVDPTDQLASSVATGLALSRLEVESTDDLTHMSIIRDGGEK